MKIVMLYSKSRLRVEDLKKLEDVGATFYEEKGNKLEDIKELYQDEEVVLGIAPGWIEGRWEGFTWDKVNKFKNLKAVCTSTTSYGWIPFKELAKKNIPVCNVPGKSTDAVAEYYVFMMTALLRNYPKIIKNNWLSNEAEVGLGTDACGLTAGIIGLGSIGRKIADLCAGYQMNIKYWSRNKKDCVYEYLDLDELCKKVDVIFLTTVGDESTRDLINRHRINLMKKTVIFLTPIDTIAYDKQYLIEKVGKGEIGGLGFESKTEKVTDFVGNVFPAPELAYYTRQTLEKESKIMTESIMSVVNSKPVNVVNL
jgi:glycerate dehydrogenase